MKVFNEMSVDQFIQNRNKDIEQEVENLEKDVFLEMKELKYVENLVNKYTIKPVSVDFSGMHGSIEEIDVPNDSLMDIRFPRNMGLSHKRQNITHYIPVSGNIDLLRLKPSNIVAHGVEQIKLNDSNEICFEVRVFDEPKDQIESIRKNKEEMIKVCLSNIEAKVKMFNMSLNKNINGLIESKRERISKQNALLESLGIQVKKRENVPESLSLPIIKKEIAFEKSKVSNKDSNELFLTTEGYQQILRACHDLGVAMERLPNIHRDRGEESIRDILLMLLGINFESVTGETFNAEGKTDILIKQNKHNIFVAECKFWHGSKKHLETIDQLLSYLTWRESKTAIIYFNKNQKIQPVLDAIENETPGHKCFVSKGEKIETSWFNYRFHLKDDDSRYLDLAVLVFNLNG